MTNTVSTHPTNRWVDLTPFVSVQEFLLDVHATGISMVA